MAKHPSREPASNEPQPPRRLLPVAAAGAVAAIAVGLFLARNDTSHDAPGPSSPDATAAAFAAHTGEPLLDERLADGTAPDNALPDSAVPDNSVPDNAVPDGTPPELAALDASAPDAASSASPPPAAHDRPTAPESAPARHEAAGGDQPPPAAITREEVLEGIEAFRPVVGRCYEDVLREFPEAAGRVIVEFDVVARGGEGRVELAELGEGTTLFDNHLHDCMLESLGDVTFSVTSGDGTVRVRYPFNFVAESD